MFVLNRGHAPNSRAISLTTADKMSLSNNSKTSTGVKRKNPSDSDTGSCADGVKSKTKKRKNPSDSDTGSCADGVKSKTKKRKNPSDSDTGSCADGVKTESKKRKNPSDCNTGLRAHGKKTAGRKRHSPSDNDRGKGLSTKERKMLPEYDRSKQTSNRKRQRASGNDSGNGAATKKRKTAPDHGKSKQAASGKSPETNTLRLVPVPKAKPVKLWRPPRRQVCLDVRPGSKMFGSVNGRRCTIVLDSGCSENFIFISLAEELGLLTGEERTLTLQVTTQIGTREVKVILLDEVVINLEGQLEVRAAFQVLPKSLEADYCYEEMLLGLPVLRRGRAVQTFSKSRSRLYIRRPECLQEPLLHSRLMEVLVDTGDEDHLSVSILTYSEFVSWLPRHTIAEPPQRVSLDLGGGSCLEAELNNLLPQQKLDFIMGLGLLNKHKAVLDYARHSLTLSVGDKHLRLKLGQEPRRRRY